MFKHRKTVCKNIYIKWFKLGFDCREYYIENPNRYLTANKSLSIDFKYKSSIRDHFPWNTKWVIYGYYDGFYSCNFSSRDYPIDKWFNERFGSI